jgi:hypothetical protein
MRELLDDRHEHGLVACPACGQPVHLVVSHRAHVARWCCLGCATAGSAIYVAEGESGEAAQKARQLGVC